MRAPHQEQAGELRAVLAQLDQVHARLAEQCGRFAADQWPTRLELVDLVSQVMNQVHQARADLAKLR